jgi:hypothetical protein
MEVYGREDTCMGYMHGCDDFMAKKRSMSQKRVMHLKMISTGTMARDNKGCVNLTNLYFKVTFVVKK